MKKIISILLAAAMFISSVVLASENYSDIDDTAPYANAVERLYDFGVMRGYEDGTFRPERTVTRAEAAALMCAAQNMHITWIEYGEKLNIREGEIAGISGDGWKNLFSDVDENHWACLYIMCSTTMYPQIINGYGDGTFRPDDTITYAEFIKMCVCLLGYSDLAEKNGGYPNGYMMQAAELGLTNGLDAIANDYGITRADAAIILSNTLEAPLVRMGAWVYDSETETGHFAPEVMDGTGEDYDNLLMRYFNIYKVTASVSDPSVTHPPVEIDDEIYEKAVEDLTKLNILDNDFDPDAEITKGDFAKYARRLMYPSDAEIKSRYRGVLTDVPDDRNDIYLMLTHGYMKTKTYMEDEDTEFGIDNKMTYGQAAETFLSMLGFSSRNLENSVTLATEQGVTANITNAQYKRVIDTVTGRELALMLYNCLDKPTGAYPRSEDNTFRNKLNGKGGVNRIEDKGEKIAEFKDITIPVVDDIYQNMVKVCTVKVPKGKDIFLSLEGDFPTYVDYFEDTVLDKGFGHASSSARMPGDILLFNYTLEDEYAIYLAASSAEVTVSGAIYMKDSELQP